MDLHFVSTGPFGYMHAISVYTAYLAQKVDKINIWFTVEPTGIYFEAIRPFINLIDVRDWYTTMLPALRNKDAGFQSAHIKDHMQWKIQHEHGGLYLDMDTVSLRDITELMTDEYELFVSLEMEDSYAIPFPFNGAVVCVNPDKLEDPTNIVHSLYRNVVGLFNEKDMVWGITGPILLSMIINERRILFDDKSKVRIVPHTTFCPKNGYYIQEYYAEESTLTIPPETRVIHLFAKASGNNFTQIDANWMRKSKSLLARTVRGLVPESIWGIKPPWDVNAYLNLRGRHYAKLFEAVRNNSPKNILEIGTSAGHTAIGLIKTNPLGEENVNYYGIDVFETAAQDSLEAGFLGAFDPAKMADVKAVLETETKATINLIMGDSRTVAKFPDWPIMDLIYIDGGHSLDIVKSDWEFAQTLMNDKTVVVFDDYFSEIPVIGCKTLIDAIDRSVYNVQIDPNFDDYPKPWGHLRIHLVVVTKNIPISPIIQETCSPKFKTTWGAEIMRKIKASAESDEEKWYTVEYFKNIDRGEIEQAVNLEKILRTMYNPQSVIDWGCASGLYLTPFADRGILVLGVERSSNAISVKHPGVTIKQRDMGESVFLGKFELALCLEVLEHIDEKFVNIAIKNVTMSANRLVVSMAPPGQDGAGHVNMQPKSYWLQKFAKRGFEQDVDATKKLVGELLKGYHYEFLTNNIMVLERVRA